jgi:hypothetical protein
MENSMKRAALTLGLLTLGLLAGAPWRRSASI